MAKARAARRISIAKNHTRFGAILAEGEVLFSTGESSSEFTETAVETVSVFALALAATFVMIMILALVCGTCSETGGGAGLRMPVASS